MLNSGRASLRRPSDSFNMKSIYECNPDYIIESDTPHQVKEEHPDVVYMNEIIDTTDTEANSDESYKLVMWPIGKVEVVDIQGSDIDIVNAARVSFDKDASQYTPKQNRNLIRYLYRNMHTSPFEMAGVTLRIEAPIFVARQWVRHRTASINETSRRYVDNDPEFYIPPLMRKRSEKGNKQGSDPNKLVDLRKDIPEVEKKIRGMRVLYSSMINEELIAPEEARMVLPQSMMTQWVWKMDLHNLFHFLRLRLDEHAQKEIRVFAEKIIRELESYGNFAWSLEIFDEMRRVQDATSNLINTHKHNLDTLADTLNNFAGE